MPSAGARTTVCGHLVLVIHLSTPSALPLPPAPHSAPTFLCSPLPPSTFYVTLLSMLLCSVPARMHSGDQQSMYNPNCSVPKTLVRSLVAWAARERLFKDDQASPARPPARPPTHLRAPLTTFCCCYLESSIASLRCPNRPSASLLSPTLPLPRLLCFPFTKTEQSLSSTHTLDAGRSDQAIPACPRCR